MKCRDRPRAFQGGAAYLKGDASLAMAPRPHYHAYIRVPAEVRGGGGELAMMAVRVTIGIVAILCFHLWGQEQLPVYVSDVWRVHGRYVDEVSAYEWRFDAIKPDLPAHGPIGYRADAPVKRGPEELFIYEIDGVP